MKLRLIAATLVAASVAACQTAPPLFEFGSYEQSLYTYYKKPDQADRYRESLEKAIEKGEGAGNLAPGLYAELGYLSFTQGDYDTAIALYKKEIAAFPESEFFLSKVISVLNSNDDADAAVAPAEVSEQSQSEKVEG